MGNQLKPIHRQRIDPGQEIPSLLIREIRVGHSGSGPVLCGAGAVEKGSTADHADCADAADGAVVPTSKPGQGEIAR
jgi:hypothetical protein